MVPRRLIVRTCKGRSTSRSAAIRGRPARGMLAPGVHALPLLAPVWARERERLRALPPAVLRAALMRHHPLLRRVSRRKSALGALRSGLIARLIAVGPHSPVMSVAQAVAMGTVQEPSQKQRRVAMARRVVLGGRASGALAMLLAGRARRAGPLSVKARVRAQAQGHRGPATRRACASGL